MRKQLRPGSEAERRAANHFRLRGYRVLARNAWAAGNELDLVVRRGRRVIFAEVKEKTGLRYGDPAEMVGEEKVRRVRRAAEAWLARRPELEELELHVEVVAVTPRGVRRIRLDEMDTDGAGS